MSGHSHSPPDRRPSLWSRFSGMSRATDGGGDHATRFNEDELITDPTYRSTPEEIAAAEMADDTLKIRDDAVLNLLGKEIKQAEEELARRIAEDETDWNDLQKPMYEQQLTRIAAQIKAIESQIEKNAKDETALKDDVAQTELNKEYEAHKDVLEDTKKRVYFPHSKYTLGGDGVYIALDDFWLEYASGTFAIDALPGVNPQVVITLTKKDLPEASSVGSSSSSANEGLCLRLKADGFKLAGDKGKGVPKIKLSELKITLQIKVEITLTFDSASKQWKTSAKDFVITLLAFRGPFGISRTLVATILTLVKPLIRKAVCSAVPVEIGLIIKSLPSRFSVRGSFDIYGTKLRALTSPMLGTSDYSTAAAKEAGLSQVQSQMFQLVQRALGYTSNPLTTLSMIIQYRHKFASRYPSLWTHTQKLWNNAIKHYSECVQKRRVAKGRKHGEELSFDYLMEKCDEALQKPIDLRFELFHLTGEFNLNKGLTHVYTLLKRMADEKVKEGGVMAATAASVSRHLEIGRKAVQDILVTVKNNLDAVEALVRGNFHTGTDSALQFSVSGIRARMPIRLFLGMPEKITLGRRSPVEFLFTIFPHSNGEISIYFDHMISDQLEHFLVETSIVPSGPPKVGASQVSRRVSIGSLEHLQTIKTGKMKESIQDLFGLSDYSVAALRLQRLSDAGAFIGPEDGKDAPEGIVNRVSRIFDIVVGSPKVTFVADRETFIRPDQELFTLGIQGHDDVAKSIQSSSQVAVGSGVDSNLHAAANCYLVCNTLPGIKLQVVCGLVRGYVDLARVQLFGADMYADVPLFKEFLQKLFSCVIEDEIIDVGASILDLTKKYILRSGIDVDFSIIAMMRSEESGDIIAAVGTPRGHYSASDPLCNSNLSRTFHDDGSSTDGDGLTVVDESYNAIQAATAAERAVHIAAALDAGDGSTAGSGSAPAGGNGQSALPVRFLRVRAKFKIADVIADFAGLGNLAARAFAVAEMRQEQRDKEAMKATEERESMMSRANTSDAAARIQAEFGLSSPVSGV